MRFSEITRGLRLLMINAVLATLFGSATVGTFSTGFAVELGASDFLVGWLGAAPGFGQILQFFSPFVIERLRARKPLCLLLYLGGYLVWVPIALLPWLPAAVPRVFLLLGLLFVSTSLFSFALPAGISWITDLIPENIRGRYMGRQNALAGIAGLLVTLAAGRFVELPPKLHSFAFLFAFGVACGLAAVAVLSATPEPLKRSSPRLPVWRFIGLPFRRPRFRNFMAYLALRSLATFIAAPFFILFMLKFLKVPYFEIGLFTAVSSLATMVTYPLWGYLADKYGNLPVMKLCAFGLSVIPGLWLFATPGNYRYLLPLFFAYAGVVAAGFILSQFNLLMKIAPEQNRTVYLGTCYGLIGVGSAVGPVIGGTIAKAAANSTHLFGVAWTNIHYVMVVSCACRLLTTALLPLIRERNVAETGEMVRQVVGRHPLSALVNLVLFLRRPRERARVQALHGLGAARARVAVSELVASLDDPSYEVRRGAARVLGDIGDREAVAPLRAKLFDPTADVIEECAVSLGKIGDPDAVPALTELLDRPHRSVRKNAIIALGALPGEASTAALWEQLEREHETSLRALIADGLARHGEARVARVLRSLLRECHSPLLRRQSAYSLARLLGDSNAFYGLLQTEPLALSGAAQRLVRAAGAELTRGFAPAERDALLRELQRAVRYFEQADYRHAIGPLRRAVTEALTAVALRQTRSVAGPHGVPPAEARRALGDLVRSRDPLQRNLGFLTAQDSEAHRRAVEVEDALLAFHAVQMLADEVDRMRREQGRGGHVLDEAMW